MNIRDVYQKAYCGGETLSDDELYEAIQSYRHAMGALIFLGPCFAIAFKEVERCYLWLDSVARARGMI